MPAFISQIIEQHPDAGYWHQQYPWFSIGQLVNAANNNDTPAFTQSAQVAAVFFNDIPRLHWLLHQQDVDVEAIKALLNTQSKPVESQTDISTTLPQEVKETEAVVPNENETEEQSIEAVKTIDETDLATNADTAIVEKPIVTEADENKGETVATPQPVTSSDTIQQVPPDGMPMEQVASDEPNQLVEENQTELANTETNNSETPIGIISAEPTSIDETSIFKTGEPKATITDEEQEIEEPELIPLSTGMLSESLAQAADRFKNTPVDEEALVFKTAYQHTIDYFASQGIKLDMEPAKDDRFGQQLKTFTSWLRQMKRLPNAPVPEADPLVESHAAHSLQTGEVLTEPMADVLLKQGKNGQAIAVLEKLRLLHPSKSHYFASRIQQIKHL